MKSRGLIYLLNNSSDLQNGGGCPGITELAPPTARLTYIERWTKNKIDLLELVTLREAGLTWREVAERMGVCKTTALRAAREGRH
jgi:hypothetical protein